MIRVMIEVVIPDVKHFKKVGDSALKCAQLQIDDLLLSDNTKHRSKRKGPKSCPGSSFECSTDMKYDPPAEDTKDSGPATPPPPLPFQSQVTK
jgi:hypothetical protein